MRIRGDIVSLGSANLRVDLADLVGAGIGTRRSEKAIIELDTRAGSGKACIDSQGNLYDYSAQNVCRCNKAALCVTLQNWPGTET